MDEPGVREASSARVVLESEQMITRARSAPFEEGGRGGGSTIRSPFIALRQVPAISLLKVSVGVIGGLLLAIGVLLWVLTAISLGPGSSPAPRHGHFISGYAGLAFFLGGVTAIALAFRRPPSRKYQRVR